MPEPLDILLIRPTGEAADPVPSVLDAEAEKAGARLFSAAGAEEALQLLARYVGLIDAVLIGPGPEGEHGLRRIRTLYPTLPVIALASTDTAAGATAAPGLRAALAQLRRGAGMADSPQHRTPLNALAERPFVLNEPGKRAQDGRHAAYFAYHLDRMARPRSDAETGEAVRAALGWHRRLLGTLACFGRAAAQADTDVRLHLRYVGGAPPGGPHPDEHPFTIALVAAVEAAGAAETRDEATALRDELTAMLGPGPRTGAGVYHFAPVRTEAALRRSLLPFFPRAAARLMPHLHAIRLPAALLALKGLDTDGPNAVSLDLPLPPGEARRPLQSLCDALTRRPQPALIDCVLRPAPLTPAEEHRLRAAAHMPVLRETAQTFAAPRDVQLTPDQEKVLAARAEALLATAVSTFDTRVYLAEEAEALAPGLQAAALDGFFGTVGAASPEPAYPETEKGMLRMRAPGDRTRDALASRYDADEAARIVHLPLPQRGETPGLLATHPAREHTPEALADEGPLLGVKQPFGKKPGTSPDERLVRLAPEDLHRHVYVLGQTGTGKSTMLRSMIAERIAAGAGVGLLDPHGDLWSDIRDMVPDERAGDVVTFDPSDPACSVRLNLLEYAPARPEERAVLIEEMLSLFCQEYDAVQTMGPMFDTYMRNAMLLVMDAPRRAPGTLLDVVKVFRDDDYRRRRLALCTNDLVTGFWEQETQGVSSKADHSLRNITPYVTSKLNAFLYNDSLRRLISAPRSTIDFREIIDEGKILLVRLPKGRLGGFGVRLFGHVLFARLLMAALARENVPEEERRPFYLFADEFQHFTSEATASMLTEARKYRLGLTLANQALGQLRRAVRRALLGSAGSMVVFRPGVEDYEHVAPYVAPPFTREEVLRLPNFTAVARLLVGGRPAKPFLFETCPPTPPS